MLASGAVAGVTREAKGWRSVADGCKGAGAGGAEELAGGPCWGVFVEGIAHPGISATIAGLKLRSHIAAARDAIA